MEFKTGDMVAATGLSGYGYIRDKIATGYVIFWVHLKSEGEGWKDYDLVKIDKKHKAYRQYWNARS